MASFSEFARFCSIRTGCDKGGLYAIQPRGLRGSPIKIGYSFNLLRRLSDWEYNYPEGIDILGIARMNRPNDTHFHKRRALQLAEALLKHELHQYVVAREEWLQPWAKAETLAAMRRLQLSLSPNLAGHFFDAAQPALLYLVPACIGASLLTAWYRKELPTLLNFSVEKATAEKEETKKD